MLDAETFDEQIEKLGRSEYATHSNHAAQIQGILKGKALQRLLG